MREWNDNNEEKKQGRNKKENIVGRKKRQDDKCPVPSESIVRCWLDQFHLSVYTRVETVVRGWGEGQKERRIEGRNQGQKGLVENVLASRRQGCWIMYTDLEEDQPLRAGWPEGDSVERDSDRNGAKRLELRLWNKIYTNTYLYVCICVSRYYINVMYNHTHVVHKGRINGFL